MNIFTKAPFAPIPSRRSRKIFENKDAPQSAGVVLGEGDHRFISLTLRALKAEPIGELLGDALWDEPLLFSLSDSALERFLRYILNAEDDTPRLRKRITQMSTPNLQSKTMSIADQFKLEGKKEGLSEGRLSALRSSVLRALEIRHGAYPEGMREAIEALEDPKQLDGLLESAFRSESIEAFAQNL